jgi:hypothetical protein
MSSGQVERRGRPIMGRSQLQRWRYECDGHWQNGVECPVERFVDAVDITAANSQVIREGWRGGGNNWLCGYSLHAEDVCRPAAGTDRS